MQMFCYSRVQCLPQSSSQAHNRRKGRPSRIWFLNVIIYGTVAIEDAVDQYLSRNRAYLQDPIDCKRNVLYRNPHMISHDGKVLMTDSFKASVSSLEIERLSVGPDLLAQLMAEQSPLPETEPPDVVTTSLFWYLSLDATFDDFTDKTYSHQKQALTFMMQRERGWNFESNRDVWSIYESHPGHSKYSSHSKAPRTLLT